MELILIRHATPEIADGICYGQLDLPLRTPVAPDPSTILATCGKKRPTRLIASPQLRAQQTAKLLLAGLANQAVDPVPVPLVLETEPRLRELDFGCWEGNAWDAIPRVDLDRWADDLLHGRPHGGESASQVLVRVGEWGDAMMRVAAERKDCVWVVCHAGPMRMLAAHWLKVPMELALGWKLGWGATCAFTLDGTHARLGWWNRS